MSDAQDKNLEALNETARQLVKAFKAAVRVDRDKAAVWLKQYKADLKGVLQAAKPK